MIISIFNTEEIQKSIWSGGSSIQLYISPVGSSYAERNFDVRISTAKVETEESVFTSLPGFNRQLMILDGEIDIIHLNRYQKHLKPFDVDSFAGEWTTTSVGTCTDFNVMTGSDKESELSSLEMASGEKLILTPDVKWKTFCLYVYLGKLKMEIGFKSYELVESQFALVSDPRGELIYLEASDQTILIVVKLN